MRKDDLNVHVFQNRKDHSIRKILSEEKYRGKEFLQKGVSEKTEALFAELN